MCFLKSFSRSRHYVQLSCNHRLFLVVTGSPPSLSLSLLTLFLSLPIFVTKFGPVSLGWLWVWDLPSSAFPGPELLPCGAMPGCPSPPPLLLLTPLTCPESQVYLCVVFGWFLNFAAFVVFGVGHWASWWSSRSVNDCHPHFLVFWHWELPQIHLMYFLLQIKPFRKTFEFLIYFLGLD